MARVRLPGGRLDADGLDALADGAALGNGLVELTSRASVQLRGLDPARATHLARRLADGGLLPSPAHDRVRNLLASPLAGRHPDSRMKTDPVLTVMDDAICVDAGLAALPGRFLFAIDDGAGLVDAAAADVALVAEGRGRLRLHLGGKATDAVSLECDAVACALDAARAFLTVRADLAPGAWHVTDLPDGAASLAAKIAVRLTGEATPARDARLAPGTTTQRDSRAAVTVLPPLARLDQAQLVGLAALLREHAAGDARVAPWRTLTLVDLDPAQAREITRALDNLGLVTTADSGWNGLSACSGEGACARALLDVRAAASVRAGQRGPGAPTEHWSGCERRCGMKRDVDQAVIAGEDGIVARPAGAEPRFVAGVDEALALMDRAPAAVGA